MTCLLAEKAVSSLREGIETVVVPVTHPSDLKDLVFHSQRGGIHDVVEWLLSQLYRSSEIDRVCGLTVTPLYEGVVQVNLEMRQPGRQMEQWLRENIIPGGGRCLIGSNDGKTVLMDYQVVLCERALSKEKFTDKHRPWWEKEIPLLPPSVTGEAMD